METIVHAVFLTGVAIIAVMPVFMVRGIGAMAAWLAWIALWGTLAVLTARDVFVFDPQILRLATHFGGQIATGVGLFALWPRLRRAIRAVPLEALVRWQVARVIGGFFVIGALMGEVSVPFALVAGTGDVLVGIAAARTVRAMKTGDAPRLARRHAWLGLADFSVAIGTAILTGAKIGGMYILIPLLLVPMAVLGHLAVLDRNHGRRRTLRDPAASARPVDRHQGGGIAARRP